MIKTEIDQILEEISAKTKSLKEENYFLTHFQRYQFLLRKIKAINLPKSAKILDIGCYPPHLFQALEKMGFKVWGISSTQEKINHSRVATLNIETDKFPYKSNFFDLVLFSEILEHLPHSPLIPLEEVKRVLKPGGCLCLSTPNVARLKNRFLLLFGKNIYFTLDQLFEALPENEKIYHLHNREYTMEELVFLLEKSGFRIRQKEYYIGSSFRQLFLKGLGGKISVLAAKTIQQVIPSFRNYLFVYAVKSKE